MKAFFSIFGVFLLLAPAFAAEGGWENLPYKMTLNRHDLIRNGEGKQTWKGKQIYVVALYLIEQSNDPTKILTAEEPTNIRLRITTFGITPNQMKEIIMEGFKRSTNGNIAPLKQRIDSFLTIFDRIYINDVYDLAYIPGTGVEASKNGAALLVIDGLDFKNALYGMFIGDKALQNDLKAKLLSK
jgi:hypothetical protein